MKKLNKKAMPIIGKYAVNKNGKNNNKLRLFKKNMSDHLEKLRNDEIESIKKGKLTWLDW